MVVTKVVANFIRVIMGLGGNRSYLPVRKRKKECSSVDLVGLSHGCLDVNALEVVPSLLEEGSQEVNTHEDVLSELFLSHLLVTNGNGHAGNLLKLELDGSTGIIDLSSEVLVVSDDLGEHLNLVEDGSKDDWDLLDEGITGKKESVLLSPLLDQLLVLVEGLETIEVHNVDLDALSLSDIDVLGITDEADLEALSWNVGKADGSSETLVLLGIVVLEADLEFDCLSELSFLLLVGVASLENVLESFSDLLVSNVLAHFFLRYTLIFNSNNLMI